jgi:hypothetical protein
MSGNLPKTVTIAAREKWNDTGIDLAAGGRYRLAAAGEWIDWTLRSGPEGYPSPNGLMRATERWRRAPREPWFALIGSIGRDPAALFPIGRGLEISAAKSGRLFCFANDVSFMYWNNSGSVELTVERIG